VNDDLTDEILAGIQELERRERQEKLVGDVLFVLEQLPRVKREMEKQQWKIRKSR